MSRIDRPEPRWQVIFALLAVAGIYLALPKELVVGPAWLLPVLVVVLLVPTVFAHRTGRHSLNHVLGIVINAIITFRITDAMRPNVMIGTSFAQPCSGHRDQRDHHVRPHRIGDSARHYHQGRAGTGAGAVALGRGVVADERPGVRALVLEAGRRRPDQA